MMAEATTVVGLFLDIVGVVLLYFFAPEKIPDPQTKAGFRIKAEVRKSWEKSQAKRRKAAGFSVFLIVLGFALQLLGEAVAAGWLDLAF